MLVLMQKRLTTRNVFVVQHESKYKKDESIIRRAYRLVDVVSNLGGLGSLSLLVPKAAGNVEVENFSVPSPEQGRGLGSTLLRAALFALREEGHHTLFSDEVSVSALFARRKAHGVEAMQFYLGDDYNNILPEVTFHDAVARAAYAECCDPPPGFAPGIFTEPAKEITPYGVRISLIS